MTFRDFGVYGCSVITALNAQNSFALGASAAAGRKAVVAQINALDSDLPAAAIKLGMLPTAEIVESVVKYLEDYSGFVVYDIELDNSGAELLSEAGDLLRAVLIPRVDLLVVNVEEAVALTDVVIDSPASMVAAAEALLVLGARAVLITGAHFSNRLKQRYDYWAESGQGRWVIIDELASVNNRGGGSTLAAAITAAVARGHPVAEAIKLAKAYVTQGIRGSLSMGSGPGAVAHLGWPEGEADWPLLTEQPPLL